MTEKTEIIIINSVALLFVFGSVWAIGELVNQYVFGG